MASPRSDTGRIRVGAGGTAGGRLHPPSYYPSGPGTHATDAVKFTAYDKAANPFVIQFWREPCAGIEAKSLLYARFACGTYTGFAMLQNGATGLVEYGVLLRGSCTGTAMTTFLIE